MTQQHRSIIPRSQLISTTQHLAFGDTNVNIDPLVCRQTIKTSMIFYTNLDDWIQIWSVFIFFKFEDFTPVLLLNEVETHFLIKIFSITFFDMTFDTNWHWLNQIWTYFIFLTHENFTPGWNQNSTSTKIFSMTFLLM